MEMGTVAPGRLIALTGYGQDEDRERTRQTGFHAHMVKPVELDELTQVTSRFHSA